MATIVTRAGKGAPLTHNEVDANFTNLNSDKLESGDTVASLTLTSVDINGGAIDGTVIGGATPAAGTFTTLTATGNVVVSGTVDGRDVAADGSKLDGIEAGADVTDTANVTAAGALMDSEVTNLAAVKAFDPTDYATAAQGSLADSALQPGDAVPQTSATGSAEIPTGTAAQRDGSPSAGYLRFNTDDASFEGYDGTAWGSIGGGAGLFKGENGEVGSSAGDIFRINEQTLNTNVTIDADENASCTGPLTVASGVTLTVTSGGNLSIV